MSMGPRGMGNRRFEGRARTPQRPGVAAIGLSKKKKHSSASKGR